MQYTHLGRTALSVSRLCLGTMNFGPKTSEEDSHRIMDRALELGINFFDTADVYGWKPNQGWTEEIIGRWWAGNATKREKVVIATKCYNPMGKGDLDGWPNTEKLSAVHIRRACEASLKRLQTDYIDLYQMHHIDRHAPWEEVWQAMEVLVQQGKVVYVGSSNFAGWHIAEANEKAAKRNFLGLVSEQSKYSLIQRDIELEVIPACERYGMGVIPWSPLGSGLLAGKSDDANARRNEGWATEAGQKFGAQLEKWESLCADLGEKPADVALAWMLHNPVITAPIIGPRTMEQLEGSIRAVEVKLEPETLAKIDEIFPGKKTAPEDYAW